MFSWIKSVVAALRCKEEIETQLHWSPSNRYQLEVKSYDTGKGYWNYTKGIISDDIGNIIATVCRNYSRFPFAWVEDHSKGDFLVCGENYQGQTVINLQTAERVNYLPEEAKHGFGFCWASFEPNEEKTKLEVDGCIWAGPYETIVVDFSEPMNPPWPVFEGPYCDDDDDEDE